MASGPAGPGLAHKHHAGEPVRPHHPPHHLRGAGPPLRPAPGGRQPGTYLCPEHETRQAPVLSPSCPGPSTCLGGHYGAV